MKKLGLLFVLSMVLTSCLNTYKDQNATETTSNQETFESLKKESMEAHDVVMPQMGELQDLSKQVRDKMAVIRVTDSTVLVPYTDQVRNLEKAHDGMMTWMEEYSAAFPYEYKLPEEAEAQKMAVANMKIQRDNIVNLSKETELTIKQAKLFLSQQ